MGNTAVKEAAQASALIVTGIEPVATKPKCRACCACPETKKARDKCIIERGQENCGDFIEAHKKCMRAQGFRI